MKIITKAVEYLVFIQDPNVPERPSAAHVTAIRYLDMEDGSPLRALETLTFTPEKATEAGLDLPEIAKQFAAEDRIACERMSARAAELSAQLETVTNERDEARKVAEQLADDVRRERDAASEQMQSLAKERDDAEKRTALVLAAAQAAGIAVTND